MAESKRKLPKRSPSYYSPIEVREEKATPPYKKGKAPKKEKKTRPPFKPRSQQKVSKSVADEILPKQNTKPVDFNKEYPKPPKRGGKDFNLQDTLAQTLVKQATGKELKGVESVRALKNRDEYRKSLKKQQKESKLRLKRYETALDKIEKEKRATMKTFRDERSYLTDSAKKNLETVESRDAEAYKFLDDTRRGATEGIGKIPTDEEMYKEYKADDAAIRKEYIDQRNQRTNTLLKDPETVKGINSVVNNLGKMSILKQQMAYAQMDKYGHLLEPQARIPVDNALLGNYMVNQWTLGENAAGRIMQEQAGIVRTAMNNRTSEHNNLVSSFFDTLKHSMGKDNVSEFLKLAYGDKGLTDIYKASIEGLGKVTVERYKDAGVRMGHLTNLFNHANQGIDLLGKRISDSLTTNKDIIDMIDKGEIAKAKELHGKEEDKIIDAVGKERDFIRELAKSTSSSIEKDIEDYNKRTEAERKDKNDALNRAKDILVAEIGSEAQKLTSATSGLVDLETTGITQDATTARTVLQTGTQKEISEAQIKSAEKINTQNVNWNRVERIAIENGLNSRAAKQIVSDEKQHEGQMNWNRLERKLIEAGLDSRAANQIVSNEKIESLKDKTKRYEVDETQKALTQRQKDLLKSQEGVASLDRNSREAIAKLNKEGRQDVADTIVEGRLKGIKLQGGYDKSVAGLNNKSAENIEKMKQRGLNSRQNKDIVHQSLTDAAKIWKDLKINNDNNMQKGFEKTLDLAEKMYLDGKKNGTLGPGHRASLLKSIMNRTDDEKLAQRERIKRRADLEKQRIKILQGKEPRLEQLAPATATTLGKIHGKLKHYKMIGDKFFSGAVSIRGDEGEKLGISSADFARAMQAFKQNKLWLPAPTGTNNLFDKAKITVAHQLSPEVKIRDAKGNVITTRKLTSGEFYRLYDDFNRDFQQLIQFEGKEQEGGVLKKDDREFYLGLFNALGSGIGSVKDIWSGFYIDGLKQAADLINSLPFTDTDVHQANMHQLFTDSHFLAKKVMNYKQFKSAEDDFHRFWNEGEKKRQKFLSSKENAVKMINGEIDAETKEIEANKGKFDMANINNRYVKALSILEKGDPKQRKEAKEMGDRMFYLVKKLYGNKFAKSAQYMLHGSVSPSPGRVELEHGQHAFEQMKKNEGGTLKGRHGTAPSVIGRPPAPGAPPTKRSEFQGMERAKNFFNNLRKGEGNPAQDLEALGGGNKSVLGSPPAKLPKKDPKKDLGGGYEYWEPSKKPSKKSPPKSKASPLQKILKNRGKGRRPQSVGGKYKISEEDYKDTYNASVNHIKRQIRMSKKSKYSHEEKIKGVEKYINYLDNVPDSERVLTKKDLRKVSEPLREYRRTLKGRSPQSVRSPDAEMAVGAGLTATGAWLGKKLVKAGLMKVGKDKIKKMFGVKEEKTGALDKVKGMFKKGDKPPVPKKSNKKIVAGSAGGGAVAGGSAVALTGDDGYDEKQSIETIRDNLSDKETVRKLKEEGVDVRTLIEFLDEKIEEGGEFNEEDLKELDERIIQREDEERGPSKKRKLPRRKK